MTAPSIILIGPLGAGKTTIGAMLGARLGWPWIDVDDLRWAYYAEIGYDPVHAEALRQEGGFVALGRYWKPFEAYAVERVVQDYPTDTVIAFGAGNSAYGDPEQFARVQRALAPFPYVILLMPVPDIEQSAVILRDRIAAKRPDLTPESHQTMMEINREFMSVQTNALLATHTVYSDGRTPEQVCDAIMALL